ncbi:mechanosensitive channel of small conductance-like 5 [Arabidopsis thaliana]|uniref:Mechanosensitive ion channel protein n=1 Tax=Arabidopsis thaliana TaxID=3702 RepID=F4IWA1_ARATH|nr:mechanosensitive channel of small conductance-like 5 [Arabidopsis thaliana]AEE75569.1 mechanosensitive channel of small conductance-like 5 [Arabidopsis thaliana]|eukprot:NP_001189895.1 mechanosensitive channel of small conductance-like 5 [Arabidopsis thaliana]
MAAVDSTDRRDFIVNINGQESGAVGATGSSSNAEGGNIWKESSYDFWDGEKGKNDKKGDDEDEDGGSFHFRQRGERRHSSAELSDPPSKLIGQFLHKQRASGDEISLDVELNMAELQSNTPPRPATASNTPRRGLTTISESSSPVKTKVKADAVRRRQNRTSLGGSSDEEGRNRDEAEVLKCGSKKPMLSRNKTKSRLQDPPTPTHPAIDKTEMKSGRRSGIFKSGFLGKSPKAGTPGRNGFEEEEEEDPFLDEDLPEEFKRDKLSFWVFLEWISLVLIVTSLVCSLTIHNLQRKTWWKLDLWKWEVTVLVLICGRLVSSWIVRIIVFLVEKNFTWRKRVLYFVYGVRKSVQNCLWLGLVLLAWHFLFDKKVERETRSTALRTYFDRIQESLFTQYVIETLSGPPLMEIQRMEEEEQQVAEDVKSLEKLAGAKLPPALKATVKSFMKVGKSPGLNRIGSKRGEDGEGIRIDQLKRMNTKNVSAWNMKRLMNIILKGAISTLDQNMQDTTQEDEDATHIRSEYEAKCAARKIFHNVTEPGSRYIYLEDFLRFLCEEEAERAMALFEGASESDKISKSCLKNWVAFRERRALALTLNDTKTAVDRLHRIINVVIGIIIIIIWLLILGIATTRFLLVLSSQLLLVAFVFGNSCKTIFEAIIFLFVMHPFDVGDRCEIDGVQLVVEEMNILTTVFLRYDNQKIIYPNSVLGTKPIANYYRSPDMGDAVEFCVHIATPPEKITAIKQRILSYVDNKKDYWYPAPMIVFLSMDDLNSVKIAVWLTHRMNHQDMGERYIRRGLLLEEVGKTCRELDIEYRLYPLNINVRSLPPTANPTSSDRIPPSWMQQRGP